MKITRYRKSKYYDTGKFIKMTYPSSKIILNNLLIRFVILSPYFNKYIIIVLNSFKIVIRK